MGVDVNTHVGAYLRVKDRQEDTTAVKIQCPEIACKHIGYSVDEFCPKHGHKLVNREYKKKEWVAQQVIYSYPDDLTCPGMDGTHAKGFDYYISNKKTCERRESLDTLGDCEPMEIDPAIVEKEKVSFIEVHRELLSKLVAELGADNVVVGWGVLVYWS